MASPLGPGGRVRLAAVVVALARPVVFRWPGRLLDATFRLVLLPFAAPVLVPPEATASDRLIGYLGRDPG